MVILRFLTGDTYGGRIEKLLKPLGIGRMFSVRPPSPYEGEMWGFDNGAYVDWTRGRMFDEGKYLRRLDSASHFHQPYIAIVPDMVAQGLESLDFSLRWLERLPPTLSWYLAVQDGMGLEDVEAVLDRFAGIFLGGTSEFKMTAYHWAQLAHKHDRLFHYGRCGTPKKLWHARGIGADSIDSAYPLWRMERWEEFVKALHSTMPAQQVLWQLAPKPVRRINRANRSGEHN